ncbi:RNA polymerase sigma factor (sigma-70 family) [Actinokineospora baliensis]|uniref:sigma-70 family RNA polymerase sigma factor n=1 Tax=Actinokineospora baliensis TaxID=547056 RepID=UPI0027DC2D4F|nr:sigma-70 family RNA polymerase sigma factor [Actinokineospora baliensis]MBM7776094.1 RNA polymerase sigma factor (sigma-70 family) [Actinokineospora baliensis]
MARAPDVNRTLDAVWKAEAARVVGALTRMVGDVGLAEELAQEALVSALRQWPRDGVPDNPAAWLTAVAKRRAVDHLRRVRRERDAAPEAVESIEDDQPDDVLRLVFLACHPALSTAERVALTLKLVCGLTTEEIARAFLVDTPTIAERVARAKRTLAGHPLSSPGQLSSVQEVIYLVFNEGYSATSGDDLLRPGLCLEALRLGRLLAELVPGDPEVHGLVALMELQASRAAARTGPDGEPVRLHEQNRGRWDPLLIRRGFTALLKARSAGPAGPYVLQAAIAACHAGARTAEDTDWAQIASLYDALAHLLPTPVVQLNRAVAIGMARGPEAGLELVDAITDLRDYHLLPSTRGDLLLRLGRGEEARREFERAATLTDNAAERAFLRRRADEAATPVGRAIAELATEFLAGFDPSTARSYAQTLGRLRRAVGDRTPLTSVTTEDVGAVFASVWGSASARTWNRHRSAIRSFCAWAGIADLAATVDRKVESRSVVAPVVGQPWGDDAPLRERLLWTLLRESRAPVRAVLDLDVEHLDFSGRRAVDGVTWREGTARLLPLLLRGRDRGPLFLADRRPGPGRVPGEGDLCPVTGRGRLSYERAEYLFKRATGLTLGMLRKSPPPVGVPEPG